MIDDNTLTLYFYQDGLSDEQRLMVEQELSQNQATAQRYQRLCHELKGFSAVSNRPAPAASIARWRHALDDAIEHDRADDSWWQKLVPALWFAGAASVLAIGVLIGTQLNTAYAPQGHPNQSAQSEAVDKPTVVSTAPPSALQRGLSDHLQKTQVQLVSLAATSVEQRGILIVEIVAQNRLFQRIAEQNGAADIARFLRALEPVLMSMANPQAAPNKIDSSIEQLDFELGVTLTKLNHRASNQTHEL